MSLLWRSNEATLLQDWDNFKKLCNMVYLALPQVSCFDPIRWRGVLVVHVASSDFLEEWLFKPAERLSCCVLRRAFCMLPSWHISTNKQHAAQPLRLKALLVFFSSS
jgi:hypothetical protein